MNKKTEETKTTDRRHLAEIENARLRLELEEERTKTDALSRHCIRLGKALDAAIDVYNSCNHHSPFSQLCSAFSPSF